MKLVTDEAAVHWLEEFIPDPENFDVALIFTQRDERLRPISCRSMRVNERKLYEEKKHKKN